MYTYLYLHAIDNILQRKQKSVTETMILPCLGYFIDTALCKCYPPPSKRKTLVLLKTSNIYERVSKIV